MPFITRPTLVVETASVLPTIALLLPSFNYPVVMAEVPKFKPSRWGAGLRKQVSVSAVLGTCTALDRGRIGLVMEPQHPWHYARS
jgi:hypothetical protein